MLRQDVVRAGRLRKVPTLLKKLLKIHRKELIGVGYNLYCFSIRLLNLRSRSEDKEYALGRLHRVEN